MESLIQDFRFGVRTFIKSPGFTVIALLTIALGIGANSAIFSVVNGVLLRPLPYPDPDRVVTLENVPVFEGPEKKLSVSNLNQWRPQARSFEFVGVYGLVSDGINLTGGSEPDRVNATEATGDFFSAIGIKPLIGRSITTDDEQTGKNHVTVLGYSLWVTRFGSDRDLIGKDVTINGVPFNVIGVMPSEMKYPVKADLWIPVAFGEDRVLTGGILAYQTIARLRPGVTAGQAQREVQTVSDELREKYSHPFAEPVKVSPLLESMVSQIRQSLLILLGAVGFVLLIACANVTNLLLARGAGRRREVAIRFALGARRLRLVRQFLLESLMLSIVGGAAGLLVALWSIDALQAIGGASLPRLGQVRLDGRVFAFTLAVSILTGMIFGLIPALQSSKVDLTVALKDGGAQSGAGKGFYRMRGLLVAGEVALALVLLIGAGLLMRSFVRLMDNSPGFNSHNVLTLSIDPPDSAYPKAEQKNEFFQRVTDRIQHLPGVTAVSVINSLPFAGFSWSFDFKTEDDVQPGENRAAIIRSVGPDFFRAMGMAILKGRSFDGHDIKGSAPVIIINQIMAEKLYPGRDALGKHIFLEGEKQEREIVGIVPNLRHHTLDETPQSEMYLPNHQYHSIASTIVIQTAVSPMSLIDPIREEVRALDKDLPVYDVKTMDQRLAESVAERRFTLILLGTFAATSVILAAIGIYGVMSYSVTRQTHEIGIRMALGAQRSHVLKAIIRQGMSMTAIGVVIGLIAALALTRSLESLLYGVKAIDPLTFVLIPVVLIIVALLACLVPALRATKVDPMVALRYD